MAAVTQDANALQFAHEKLRANPKIVLQVIDFFFILFYRRSLVFVM